MNKNKENISTFFPVINKRIAVIQNNILDQTLVVLLFASIIGISLSFSRTIQSGFQLSHVFQIIHLVILGFTVVFRKKIPYTFKYSVLIGIMLLLAVFGINRFGLLGNGVMFLIAASVLTSAFTSRRYSFSVLVFSAVVIIVFMHLFVTGRIIVSFDQNLYHKFYTPWIGILVIFLMFTGMLVSVISGLFRKLRELVIESDTQLHHIETLNATLEEKVLQRTGELELSNKDKDRILGIVAHDINNKLGGIIGYLDLLKEDDAHVDFSERRKFTNTALAASMQAKDIVTDLLNFSSQKNDLDSLVTERIDLITFINSTIDCHAPKALEKKIELKLIITSDNVYCNLNRAKFSRVLDNLITNALKFTESGGKVIVSVEKPEDGGIVIRIQDSGIGIPEALKDKIFIPFSRAGRSGTANEKSTGLGLSIAKEIVAWHKGKIWFESDERNGTTFYLWLPRA